MAFWVILSTVGVLCLLGLIMVLSVTTVKSTYEHDSASYFFSKQATFLAIGGVLMFLGLKVGHRRLAKLAKPAMASAFVLLALVLVLGDKVNGSRRWFNIGFFNVQPSEIAKLAIILWVARLMATRAREMDDWRRTILPVAVGLGGNVLLIMLEPDLGTVVVLCFVVALMLTVAGARLDVMALGAIPVAIGLGLYSFTGYHAARWTFLTPLKNSDTTNYQLLGSLSSIASGGWFGVGPGASMAKWGFLPEAHTDAIFAVIAEEMGVIGALAVIGLYVVLLGAGLRVARDAADAFGRLLAIGISSLIAVQAFVNIGVVLGVLPNKGFTLPFVSYGGSSLLVTMFAVGLLLSVAREGSAEKARIRRREAVNRTLARRSPSRGRLVLVPGETRSARKPAARKPAARSNRRLASPQPASRQRVNNRPNADPPLVVLNALLGDDRPFPRRPVHRDRRWRHGGPHPSRPVGRRCPRRRRRAQRSAALDRFGARAGVGAGGTVGDPAHPAGWPGHPSQPRSPRSGRQRQGRRRAGGRRGPGLLGDRP